MLLTKNKTAITKSNSHIDFGDILTNSKSNNTHNPVLLNEIIEGLKINPNGIIPHGSPKTIYQIINI